MTTRCNRHDNIVAIGHHCGPFLSAICSKVRINGRPFTSFPFCGILLHWFAMMSPHHLEEPRRHEVIFDGTILMSKEGVFPSFKQHSITINYSIEHFIARFQRNNRFCITIDWKISRLITFPPIFIQPIHFIYLNRLYKGSFIKWNRINNWWSTKTLK